MRFRVGTVVCAVGGLMCALAPGPADAVSAPVSPGAERGAVPVESGLARGVAWPARGSARESARLRHESVRDGAGIVQNPARFRVRLAQLPGLARLFRDLTRDLPADLPRDRQGDPDSRGRPGTADSRNPEGSQASRGEVGAGREAAALFDFEQVLAAVAGVADPAGLRTLEELRDGFAGHVSIDVAVDSLARSRDETAYRLHSLGYSPKEIADVLAGRITRAALDEAQKRLMLGARPDQVSDFLDREYRRVAAAVERRPLRGRESPADAFVVRFAAQHAVAPDLVRAVITCESGWDQRARSPAGAIGLMQLMPGTARELGVDPHLPDQNVEGGTRYLASLLRVFGSIDRALVAYNAGPGFAARYAKGEVALYGETREFVRRVLEVMGR